MASRLKPVRMVAMFAAGVVVCGLQANEAWSQGILRRIQERVQSRVPPGAPLGQTAPQGQNAPQGQAARPSASDAATQRLSPLDSTTDESTQSEDSSGRSEQRARFGGSILSRPRANQLEGNRPLVAQRASLGIRVVPLTEGSGGLRVAGIRSGSRAAEAGLRVDDVIVSVEGRPTLSAETLTEVLRSMKAGEPVRATVMRGEQTRELEIPLVDSAAIAALKSVAAEVANSGLLSELPQPATEASAVELGVTVADIGGGRGVLVQEVAPGSVAPGSTAQSAGLQVGDRIVSINGRLVRDVEALQRELSSRRVGDVVSVNAVRNDTLNAYEVELRSRAAESLPGNVAAAGTQSTGPSDARATGLPAAGDTAQAAGAGTPAGSQPILDGLRSALGGLLNRTPTNAAPQSPSIDPLDVADGEPVKRVGFDEEIKQPSNAPGASEESLPLDPPSIEELAPPAGEVDADSTRSGDLQSLEPPAESSLHGDTFSGDKDQLIRDLQEQVRQLQQRIRDLEAARP